MLLLKETMPCLVLVTTKMIFTNKKTSRKYHIFKQSKFFSSVLVRSTVRYGSVRFCIFFHGSVRFGGSVKFLVRSNTNVNLPTSPRTKTTFLETTRASETSIQN